MKIIEIKTHDNTFTLYDIVEVQESENWLSITTRDGYKRNFKKETIEKRKIYDE